jgi:hypothetical protein
MAVERAPAPRERDGSGKRGEHRNARHASHGALEKCRHAFMHRPPGGENFMQSSTSPRPAPSGVEVAEFARIQTVQD